MQTILTQLLYFTFRKEVHDGMAECLKCISWKLTSVCVCSILCWICVCGRLCVPEGAHPELTMDKPDVGAEGEGLEQGHACCLSCPLNPSAFSLVSFSFRTLSTSCIHWVVCMKVCCTSTCTAARVACACEDMCSWVVSVQLLDLIVVYLLSGCSQSGQKKAVELNLSYGYNNNKKRLKRLFNL